MSTRPVLVLCCAAGCGSQADTRSYELLAIADPGHIIEMRWVQGNDGLLSNQGTLQFARWSLDTADLQFRRRSLPQDTSWAPDRFLIGPDQLLLDPQSPRAIIRSDYLSSSLELRNSQAIGARTDSGWSQHWSRVEVDGWVESNGQGGRMHAKGIWIAAHGPQPPPGARELIWLRTPDQELFWVSDGVDAWGQISSPGKQPTELHQLAINLQGRRLHLKTSEPGQQWTVQATSLGGDQELFPELSLLERPLAHQIRKQRFRSIRYLRGERGQEVDGLWLRLGDTRLPSATRSTNRQHPHSQSDNPAEGDVPAYDRPAIPEEP